MSTRTARSAFSLLELMIVVMILGILAAVVVPRFAGATDDARSSATEATVASVRASIAAFRTRAVMQGVDPFPTLEQLNTPGVVMTQAAPANPFTGASGIQAVSASQAQDRAVANDGSIGWNYYVDNSADPPVFVFYANCSNTTTVPDGSGGTLTANEL
ncbi:MAG: type II secretion system protein [Phycisphaeraceae bacterium]|nr:MAG: type II secretion system protein [Phycisphaeraceae bacterium]